MLVAGVSKVQPAGNGKHEPQGKRVAHSGVTGQES